MKHKITITAILLLITGIFAIAAENHKEMSDSDVIITGKLSCAFCKLAHPDETCKPDCCSTCVESGDPFLLTDAGGNMYILISGEKGVSLKTPETIAMMSSKVKVKGILVKQSGIQAIYVDSIEKAEAKQVSLTGTLSCTFCKLAHPEKTCAPECCSTCVKSGDPPMLTDAEGNMYILLSGEKGMSLMTAENLKMMGGKIVVEGLLVNQSGIQVIFVDSMKKAKSM